MSNWYDVYTNKEEILKHGAGMQVEFGSSGKVRCYVSGEEKQKYTYTVSLNGGDEVEVVAECCCVNDGYLDMYVNHRTVACFKNWDFVIEEPLDSEDEDDDDTCCGMCDC